MAKVLITGVAGCIGSWSAKHLLEQGHSVAGVDLVAKPPRLELLGISEQFAIHQLDVRDAASMTALLEREMPDAVIHLAALLMPKCKSDPLTCVEVNVSSFMNVLEVARRLAFTVVYASSAWVYAPSGSKTMLGETDSVLPQSLYGVFKHTNEEMARLYAQDYGVKSAGFRPYIVYGPGRDVGLTADVNGALLAAAKGESFHIGFGGQVALHHASDVARAFGKAALGAKEGAQVYNLRGSVMSMKGVAATISSVTGTNGLVTFAETPLPIAANLSDAAFQRDHGPFEYVSLKEGMKRTLEVYNHQYQR